MNIFHIMKNEIVGFHGNSVYTNVLHRITYYIDDQTTQVLRPILGGMSSVQVTVVMQPRL